MDNLSEINETLAEDDFRELREYIWIHGARANNLNNISVKIPKNELVVVTGVSGSGKSTLTMDTLYAEGQRRYVESLSSYARQFLMRMKKPDIDFIRGICPAIAIDQRVSNRSGRSTVGSLTEIYDYLRLLFARIGRTYSPVSGEEVKRHEVHDVMAYIRTLEQGSSFFIATSWKRHERRSLKQDLDITLQKGFLRLLVDGRPLRIESLLAGDESIEGNEEIWLMVDRSRLMPDDELLEQRLADSVQTAFYEGEGRCVIINDAGTRQFSMSFEADGLSFPNPTPQLFSFNNPYGACPVCEGFGKIMGIDEDKVIPNRNLSVYDGAVACWRGEKGQEWWQGVIDNAHKLNFPVHKSYKTLSGDERDMLWNGTSYFEGINQYIGQLERESYKIQNRVMLARYRGRTTCNVCKGVRLRPEAGYVKIDGYNIADMVPRPVDELLDIFRKIRLTDHEMQIVGRLKEEICNRLQYLCDVGLPYLSLDRLASTLSGGEAQRIQLTRLLGSNLTQSMYILDEPSIGLHPRDTERLTDIMLKLRDLGNTVIVVEHEEAIMRKADRIIDMGPLAGVHGGNIVFNGSFAELPEATGDSQTAAYLLGHKSVPLPGVRRKSNEWIKLRGVSHHNLKGVDVDFPLHSLTVVTGVSGSGKSSLVDEVLYPALMRALGSDTYQNPGDHDSLDGAYGKITQIELISQHPIGKSSRSNPVTYVKVFDDIRKLFAEQQLSKIRGFGPGHFSFNVEGGRCETCKGEGEITVEMQFLADIRLECEDCSGLRYNKEVLDVELYGKNIYDVLDMTVEESLSFFSKHPSLAQKLRPLDDVGLGYVKLGQSSSTLSGGEAQRVKLASFLNRERAGEHILFMFDEPTTGLHFHDIVRLMSAIQSLIEHGHSAIIIEHNPDVIKCADHVIDLGPEGGEGGGYLVFQGTPEGLAECEASHTARYIRSKLNIV